jgi:SH3 domain protein
MSFRCLALTGLLLVAGVATAETRYISDNLVVELRRGPSTEYLILRGLEAGQAVEVLEQDDEKGYSRIRALDKDTEGWVLTRYLSNEPAAKDKLAAAERNLSTAQSRASDLETQNKQLQEQLSATQSELAELKTKHSDVSTELADLQKAAANVVEIRDQNTSLRQRLAERERRVDELTSTNRTLSSRNNQNWFVVGAGVLLGGIVIGLIAPSLRRKRRSDW